MYPWARSVETLKKYATDIYTVEGLEVVYYGLGQRRIDYVAKDEADLEKWLIETGELLYDKYSEFTRD